MIIATIIGVRPQFVKAAVLSPIIRKEHKEILIHTGQHYDDNMSAVFFRELGLPEPDYNLKACSDGVNTVEDTVERMTGNLISVLRKEQVDAVLLYEDTNSNDENKLKNIILTGPAGYFDSIHLIKNAEMVVTDSGGMLQEAHFAQTPYVFVMDIDRVPDNTRFDVSRLAKPERKMILDKLKQKQVFSGQTGLSVVGRGQVLDWFERNVLRIMREFEQKSCE